MQYVEKVPSKYFTLSASMRSFEVTFRTLNSPSLTESQDSVMSRVLIIRNELMSRCNYVTSPNFTAYHSASTVYAALYSPLITKMEKPVTVSSVKKTPLITRKSPFKLSLRAIRNIAMRIIEGTERLYGAKHTLFYLESACQTSKKRKRKGNENVIEDAVNNHANNDYNQETNGVFDVQNTDDKIW